MFVGVSRQRKSQYATFCSQRFGGHQWVTIFFAFGTVDDTCISAVTMCWKNQVLKKGAQYRTSSAEPPTKRIKIGAEPPLCKCNNYHISERKRNGEQLVQMEAEREDFMAACQGEPRPKAKGWGKRGKGKGKWSTGKGRPPEWWCPNIQRWCTMADIDKRIKELHDALAQHKDDNKDVSALTQAISLIAQRNGWTQVSATCAGSKGKQPPHK